MSGPKSVAITVDPVRVLLSASGILAAMAIQRARADAAVIHQQQVAQHGAEQANRVRAQQQAHSALAAHIATAEEQFAHLVAIGERLGIADQVRATLPPAPEATDTEASADYLRGLQELCAAVRPILLAEAARQRDAHGGVDTEADFEQAAADAGGGTLAQRMLARIRAQGPVPDDIASAALELDHTPPGERAELLTLELHARIQAHLATAHQRQLQQATATIVDHVLHDLGYQVEEIGSTLFVEGGVVHFRRASWGDYMVRMRVDAKASSANFNVVRAVSEGNNERSVLDHVAEDRWCSEFPALLKALAAYGVALDVTRHLAPGELPVQLVERERLPRFADTDTNDAAQTAQPKSRTLP